MKDAVESVYTGKQAELSPQNLQSLRRLGRQVLQSHGANTKWVNGKIV